MSSHQQKKRKGYHGKRPAEVAQEAREKAVRERRHDEHEATPEHVTSTSSSEQPQTASQGTPKSKPKRPEVENVSAKKLLN